MDTATTVPTVVRRVVDDALAAAWDDLADRAGAPPFARPGWVLPWAEAAGLRLEALTAWCGPRLAGLLPVVGERGRVRTPADWHTPWVEAVAENGSALETLVAALAQTGRRRVTVDFVLAGEPTAESAVAALAAAGYRLASRARLESPYVMLQGPWEDYLASLSTHRRSELRRRSRRLETAGAVTHEVFDGPDRLMPLLEEAFAVEAAGWKGRAGTAIASDPAVAGFYRRVAAWGAERGWLRLAFLRLDGRALAFDLAFEAGGRHFLLKTGYDPAFTGLSPGLLLRLHMLERAFATGLRSYEFCGAAEPWKLEWAPATRPVLVIEAFAPGAAGSMAQTATRLSRFARVTARRLGRRQ
ncbi:MAG: GNAT family N-acetyltransferase [Actinomycetota bacterium]